MEKIKAISLEQITKMNKIEASKDIIDVACDTFVEISNKIYTDIPKNDLDLLTDIFRKMLIKKIIEN
jgi:hypothetical protein